MVVEGHCGTHCINRGMGVRGHDLGTLLQRNARPLWATGELSQKQPGGGEERGHGKGRGNKTTTTSCSQGAQLAGWSQVLASAPFQATRRLEGLCLPKGVEFRMDQKLQGQFSVLRLRALMMPETFQMAATSLGSSSVVTFHCPLHRRCPGLLLRVGKGLFTLLADLRLVAKDVLKAHVRRLPLESRKLRRGEHQAATGSLNTSVRGCSGHQLPVPDKSAPWEPYCIALLPRTGTLQSEFCLNCLLRDC